MAITKADIERRRRRRHRRAKLVIIFTLMAVGLAWFFESQATTTIIFVRHAEKMADAGSDPSLSPAGQKRARELARQMAQADVVAGVDVIYSTPYKRTLETVEPLALALNSMVVNTYSADDTEQVILDILGNHKGKIILVVGHSDTVPKLIANLGASKNVPAIADDEYDNMYIVSIPWFGKTKTIRVRYGEPYRGNSLALD